jgi:hypothetical protein
MSPRVQVSPALIKMDAEGPDTVAAVHMATGGSNNEKDGQINPSK